MSVIAEKTVPLSSNGQLAITISVSDGAEEPAPEELGEPVAWKSILAVEGELTRDNSPTPRILPVGSVTWGELPIPFFAMAEIVGEGHDGQVLVGRADAISRIAVEDFVDPDFDVSRVPPGSNIIFGTGVIQNNEVTDHFLALMRDRALRGVSVDFVSARWGLAKRDTLEFVDEETLTLDDILSGEYVLALQEGEIGGATATPLQGIGSASIALVAAAVDHDHSARIETSFGIFAIEEPAAVIAAAPVVVPRRVFFRPEPDHYLPLTVEGLEVYGHAFAWDACHIGFQHRCLRPEPSPTGYENFHLGRVQTEEGEEVWVGQIMLDTDHPVVGPGVTPEQVWKHYSDTGLAIADVRIVDGRLGGWVSGALRAVPDSDARKLKAAKLSGDWRRINGRLDLVGLLAVNVPGFPIPAPRAWLTASAAGEEVEALVAAGIVMDGTDDYGELLADLTEEPCEPCDEREALLAELAA